MGDFTDKQRLRVLAHKVKSLRIVVRRDLETRLRSLEHEVKRASAALATNGQLDSNLIMNASGIDGLIARWNTLSDLVPYVEDVVVVGHEEK